MTVRKEGKENKEGEDDDQEIVLDAKDDAAVSALLKRTLGAGAIEKEEPAPDLLRGVQRKLRQRSKGKFYGDGWGTGQTRVSYAVVALVMLVLAGVVYFVLAPMGLSAR